VGKLKEGVKEEKNEKKMRNRPVFKGTVGTLVSPRKIKIKACRAICLLKKLAKMTVYMKLY
jgi:hypothetical protein